MLSQPDHWRFYPPIFVGIGVGGFFDGIVFHFLLQWHYFASNRLETDTVGALEHAMIIDGTFHISMWVVALMGFYLLWHAGRRGFLPGSARVFSGLIMIGWGLFNILDGVVFHLVFQMHNAREAGPVGAWNAAWLAWGITFMVLGAYLAFRDRLRRSG